MALFSGAWLLYTYDALGKLNQRKVGNILQENYTYLAGSGSNATTTMVSGLEVKDITGSTRLKSYTYAYDKLGNITQIKDVVANDTINYTYDAQGQLLSHNNPDATRTEYTYDTYGNIRSKNTYTPFNDLWDGYTYTYGDAQWKDLLTKLTVTHDGTSTSGTFTYDQIGNPLSYYNGTNWTFTWRNGRQLATAKTGTKTTKYEYNADGLRTRKTNADGTYSDYYWVGSMLLAEVQYGANGAFVRTLKFLHDENGAMIGVGVKNTGETDFTSYYYAKNLQGDVVAVYRSDYTEAKGYYPTLVASYEYDPWGKVTKVKGSAGTVLSLEAYPNHIAHVNPIRYRGYYYDNETGFYYLQSRYYDPVISRFINADSYISTGQGFLGYNAFAYCKNNPTNLTDCAGNFAIEFTIGAIFCIGVALVGAVIAADALATAIVGTIELIEDNIEDLSEKLGHTEIKIDANPEPTNPENETDSKTKKDEPEPPDVTYPGDDPSVPPGDQYEWRGKQPVGGDKGGWTNTETGESWHPDFNHGGDIPPHWDYNNGLGNKWRVYPGGIIEFVH